MTKRPVKASVTRISSRRIEKNWKEAKEYEAKGYIVQFGMHPNGAYFADFGNRDESKSHEKRVGEILAKNGLSSTLDEEGNLRVRLKDGRTVTLPSSDGVIEGHTQEIMALKGKPSAVKVADAIEHSFKPSPPGTTGKSIQSEIAVTITPKGTSYTRKDIDDGVKEHLRRVNEGETSAKPRIYLHIDEETETVYYRNVRK